jgi:hypothetical protein
MSANNSSQNEVTSNDTWNSVVASISENKENQWKGKEL